MADSKERSKGLLYSALLHLFWFAIAVFGLPEFFSHPPEEPSAISIELLPISAVSNIRPSEAPPAPPKSEPKPAEKPKPAPPVKTADNTPPPPKEALKPDLTKKPEQKKPDEKKPEKKPKEKPEDLAAVLKAVRETAQDQKKKPQPNETPDNSETPKAISSQFDPSQQITMSEKDAIKSQFIHCWNVPAGAKNAQDLVVVVHVELQPDGTVTKVTLDRASQDRADRDGFFRTAAESAIRAVHLCSPLKNLPPDKYDGWKEMELNFDPKEMLN